MSCEIQKTSEPTPLLSLCELARKLNLPECRTRKYFDAGVIQPDFIALGVGRWRKTYLFAESSLDLVRLAIADYEESQKTNKKETP